MKAMIRDRVQPPTANYHHAFHIRGEEVVLRPKGRFSIELRDLEGNLLDRREQDNIITLDSGVFSGIHYGAGPNPSPAVSGLTMLCVGSGATGSILSPDAPDPRQRMLNAEVALGRKPLTTIFRTAAGAVSSVPTNIVDFTATFGEGEAVGPLNEMGLLRTISQNPLVRTPITPTPVFPAYDPTVNLTLFDVMINYGTFGVITKPSASSLSFTWRLTF